MKRIAAGVITIGIVTMVITFVTAIIGKIDTTNIDENTGMLSVWNSTTAYTTITMSILTPIAFIIGVTVLIYAIRKIMKKR